jgi:trans-aconitate methyltransferase
MSTTPTAGQSGAQSESTGNGSHLHGCPAAQQSWNAQYRAGLWDDLDSAEQPAPYLTICELYQRHVGDGALLDIGCGSGMLYRYLTEHAGLQSACYTGVDVADDAVRRATASFPGVRVSRRNYDSETVGSRFDCVIFNESLQCFDDPGAVLEKCTRDNLHPCSVLIVAMSGWEHAALWQLLERRYQLLDEQDAYGGDGLAWTVRVYKVAC